ncbi:MAG: hypothetical protein AAF750_16990 [Planctomycetota bacterium]
MSDRASEGLRRRLGQHRAGVYHSAELAETILDALEEIERLSDKPLEGYRHRTGLTCAAEYRGEPSHRIEDAITGWIADLLPHADSQVRGMSAGVRPDIVFAYARDAGAEDVLVVLEAKPVWQRWITDGTKRYSGVMTDEYGRSTGNYAEKNIRQVVSDRDKLLRHYTHAGDRAMILALVFQRPGELDERLIDAVGPGWAVASRHVVDRCNPPGDDIGLTGMVFWPGAGSAGNDGVG